MEKCTNSWFFAEFSHFSDNEATIQISWRFRVRIRVAGNRRPNSGNFRNRPPKAVFRDRSEEAESDYDWREGWENQLFSFFKKESFSEEIIFRSTRRSRWKSHADYRTCDRRRTVFIENDVFGCESHISRGFYLFFLLKRFFAQLFQKFLNSRIHLQTWCQNWPSQSPPCKRARIIRFTFPFSCRFQPNSSGRRCPSRERSGGFFIVVISKQTNFQICVQWEEKPYYVEVSFIPLFTMQRRITSLESKWVCFQRMYANLQQQSHLLLEAWLYSNWAVLPLWVPRFASTQPTWKPNCRIQKTRPLSRKCSIRIFRWEIWLFSEKNNHYFSQDLEPASISTIVWVLPVDGPAVRHKMKLKYRVKKKVGWFLFYFFSIINLFRSMNFWLTRTRSTTNMRRSGIWMFVR